jgi:ATP-dependent Zn protease
VHLLKTPKKYEDFGAKIPKGALLVGHPRTWKPLLAEATTRVWCAIFLFISSSNFMEMLVCVRPSKIQHK